MEIAHLSLFALSTCALAWFAVPVTCATTQDRFTPIGDGFFLPERDFYGFLSHGVSVFANLPDSCASVVDEPKNSQKSTFYEHSKSFYQHVSVSTGLSASLEGPFTMGTTLSIASDSIASLQTNVSGLSLDVYATKDYAVLSQDCVNSQKLSPELLLDLKSLPSQIQTPEQKSSWVSYDTFLRKYGSHIVSEVHRGSRLLQWTFSRTSDQYSQKDLTTRACIDAAKIPTQAGLLGIKPCGNYSNDKIQEAMSMTASNKLVLKGGNPDTRSKLNDARTPELIQQFLREAQTDPGAIKYRFLPVWDILKVHFTGGIDQSNFNRAMMLEQYYRGFLDFGCEFQQANGLTLRKFQYKSTPKDPVFTCTLEHVGCHSDDDCHVRYDVGPTYCYGRTCVQAEEVKDAGSKQREKLSILMNREGHHDEPPNTSCYYEVGIKARCHYTRDWSAERHQIWPQHDEEYNYGMFMSLHRKFSNMKTSVPRQEL